MTFKTKQRAAVGVAGHRARSRVRCTRSEPWRKEKRDPRSVPTTTPRCPDNRRKFNVDGRKSVVSQNIMITAAAVLMDPVCSLLSIQNTCILCKVESTQYKIDCVSKHDYRRAAVEPLFSLPTCPCTKVFTVYRKYVLGQHKFTAVPVLQWQPALIL